MVIWTVVPLEEVLEGFDAEERRLLEVRRGPLLMQVEPAGGTQVRIVRLYSTEPADYLDARWQPGMLLALQEADFSSAEV
jgi:hypothetical protein